MWRVFLCCTVRKYGRHESHYYGLDLTKTASTGCSGCDRQAANHPKGRPSADDQCGRNESERLKCLYIYRYISLSIYCEPNDAVRAVAVAKRREYISILEILKISSDLKIIVNDPRNYQSHLFISTSHSDFKNQPTGPRRVSHLGITRSLRFVNVLPKSHRRLEPLEEPWRNHWKWTPYLVSGWNSKMIFCWIFF